MKGSARQAGAGNGTVSLGWVRSGVAGPGSVGRGWFRHGWARTGAVGCGLAGGSERNWLGGVSLGLVCRGLAV